MGNQRAAAMGRKLARELGAICALAGLAIAPGRIRSAAASTASTGAPEHGAGAETVAPVAKLDPPLNGHFDANVLRNSEKVIDFRHETKDVVEFVGRLGEWQGRVSVVVEFGSASGAAELQQQPDQVHRDVQHALQMFEGRELLAPEGKYKFKEVLAATLNRRLRTAQVRQIYLTEFRLAHVVQADS